MANYTYSLNLYDVPADVAAAELERIKGKYGVLRPADVVTESRNKDAVLHSVFQWDNDTAAELYRVQQARTLINHIQVVVEDKKINITTRAFVCVTPCEAKEPRTYVPLAEVIKDDALYKDLLNQAKKDMDSFVRKYSQINELFEVKAAMLKILAQD